MHKKLLTLNCIAIESDTLELTAYQDTAYVDTTVGGKEQTVALDVKGAKKFRKALKKFIRENS